MDQSEIEAVVKDLSVLEGLDLTYRSRVEIDQTASAAIRVIEKLREEVERLEGENADLRDEAEAHNAAATQYEKDIEGLRAEWNPPRCECCGELAVWLDADGKPRCASFGDVREESRRG